MDGKDTLVTPSQRSRGRYSIGCRRYERDLWWETGFDPMATPGFVDALVDALEAQARFAGVRRIVLPRTARHRMLARAIRDRLGTDGRIRG